VPVVVGIVNPFIVLFVIASVPANVANVPVVGKVTLVAAVETSVVAKAPDCVKLPDVVNVVKLPNVNVPVFAVMDILLILVAVATPRIGVVKVGAVNVLFVNVSEPDKVANVPSTVGNVTAADVVLLPSKFIFPIVVTVVLSPKVNVALLVGVVNVILLIVLFVNVSVADLVTNVPPTDGNEVVNGAVLLPFKVIFPIVVKVVWSPNVIVALFVGVENVILFIVLFVKSSLPAKVAKVPVVGKVTLVAAVETNVVEKAPDCVKLPAVDKVVKLPNVNVALLVGCVNVILLTLVAVATPSVGVVKVGAVNVLFVNVSDPAKVANVPAVGKVTLVAAVEISVVAKAPDCVKLPAVENVVWSPIVNVALFVGCVNVILFTLVAVATPSVGVVKVGAVNVLFVNVSVPANVANVPVVGKFTVLSAVEFKVVTKAPVVENVLELAKDNVPVLLVITTLLILVAVAAPILGVVNVLFVNVSVPANVANVPVVGKVILVAAVETIVVGKAPE